MLYIIPGISTLIHIVILIVGNTMIAIRDTWRKVVATTEKRIFSTIIILTIFCVVCGGVLLLLNQAVHFQDSSISFIGKVLSASLR